MHTYFFSVTTAESDQVQYYRNLWTPVKMVLSLLQMIKVGSELLVDHFVTAKKTNKNFYLK